MGDFFNDALQEYQINDINITTVSTVTTVTTGDTTNIIGGNTGDETTISDLINLVIDANGKYHTYLYNYNEDGEIRFFTRDAKDYNDFNYNIITGQYSEPRLTYNTKIDKDGILQFYHTYTLFAPTKISGWYGVGDSIANLETGALLLGASVATIQSEVIVLQTSVNGLSLIVATNRASIIDIYNLLHTLWTSSALGGKGGWKRNPTTAEIFKDLWDALGGVVDSTSSLGGFEALPAASRIPAATANALGTWINRFSSGLAYAGIGAGLYAIYELLDRNREDNANDTLQLTARVRLDAGTNPAFTTDVTNIYVGYLLIDPLTNTGFTTIGVYEVDIQKGAELTIEIYNDTGVLKAKINNIAKYGSGFVVGETININKSSLGGFSSGTSTLIITVTQLATFDFIYSQLELESIAINNAVKNRQRRRQLIPAKEDFTDGIQITQTTETLESGEELPKLNISLKTKVTQFQYDANGVLELNQTALNPLAGNGIQITQTTEYLPSGESFPKLNISLKTNATHFQYDANGVLQLKQSALNPVAGTNITITNQNTVNVGQLEDSVYRLPYTSLKKPAVAYNDTRQPIEEPTVTSGGTVTPITITDTEYKYFQLPSYVFSYPVLTIDSTNLKAWYKFEGNGNDSTINGKNLTSVGMTYNTVDKLFTQSAIFDIYDYFTTPNDGYFSPVEFSVSLWFKQSVTDNFQQVLAFCSSGTTFDIAVGWQLVLINKNLEVWVGKGIRYEPYEKLTILTNLPINEWKHIAFSIKRTGTGNEAVIKAYLNGVLVASNNSIIYGLNTIKNFQIGAGEQYGSQVSFTIDDALMDDFRFYNIELTALQVSQLYIITQQPNYTFNIPEVLGTEATLLIIGLNKYNYIANVLLTAGDYTVSSSGTNISFIKTDDSYSQNNIVTFKPPVFTNNLITGTNITYNSVTVVLKYRTISGGLIPYIPDGFLTYDNNGTSWKVIEKIPYSKISDAPASFDELSGSIVCTTLTTSGNVGIGITNPVYRCHIKANYNDIATGFHIDASDNSTPNQYALTIYPYVIAGGQIGYRFRTQNSTGGTYTPIQINNYGSITVQGNFNSGNISCSDISSTSITTNNNNVNVGNGVVVAGKAYLGHATTAGWNGQCYVAGNTATAGNDGSFIFGKNNGAGGVRYGKIGFNSSFEICIGDASSTVNGAVTEIVRIAYNAPSGSFLIDGSGNVGIGITPSAKLHVTAGNTETGSQFMRYFNSGQNITTATQNVVNVCAIFDTSIWCKSTFLSASDSRIKNNIEDINEDLALDKILKIKPKTYNYIDVVNKGDKRVYGFIAQQINEVLPEAVSLQKDIIPNIYDTCECVGNKIYIVNCEASINTKIDIIDLSGNRQTYSINEVKEKYIIIDKEIEGDKCFVYGYEIDDHHSIDKTYIFTLNVGATQRLHRKIVEQRAEIDELKEKLNKVMAYLYLNI